jgi:hypothetical protein
MISDSPWDESAQAVQRQQQQHAECRERIEFVLGQVDLSEVVERRWLDMPQLSEAERAKLEAVRVEEASERLQALEEAFRQGHFDFVRRLLAPPCRRAASLL